MTIDYFEKKCKKTDLKDLDGMKSRAFDKADLLHYSLGLCTEAAEIADALKRHIAYGKELDRTNLIEEAGDICWYLSCLLSSIDSNFTEAMSKNVSKLEARYKSGFSEEAALNRDLKKESEAMSD